MPIRLGDRAGVVDVLPGAAGALAVGRLAMVVELERDADDVIALGLQQRRRHRGIDAARHRDDHARVLGPSLQVERIEHHGPRPSRAPSHIVGRGAIGRTLIIGIPAPDRIAPLGSSCRRTSRSCRPRRPNGRRPLWQAIETLAIFRNSGHGPGIAPWPAAIPCREVHRAACGVQGQRSEVPAFRFDPARTHARNQRIDVAVFDPAGRHRRRGGSGAAAFRTVAWQRRQPTQRRAAQSGAARRRTAPATAGPGPRHRRTRRPSCRDRGCHTRGGCGDGATRRSPGRSIRDRRRRASGGNPRAIDRNRRRAPATSPTARSSPSTPRWPHWSKRHRHPHNRSCRIRHRWRLRRPRLPSQRLNPARSSPRPRPGSPQPPLPARSRPLRPMPSAPRPSPRCRKRRRPQQRHRPRQRRRRHQRRRHRKRRKHPSRPRGRQSRRRSRRQSRRRSSQPRRLSPQARRSRRRRPIPRRRLHRWPARSTPKPIPRRRNPRTPRRRPIRRPSRTGRTPPPNVRKPQAR